MGIKQPLNSKISTLDGSVKRIECYASTILPTIYGDLNCLVFKDQAGLEHVALTKGRLEGQKGVLCRVHSECLTGEVFSSLKCDCKQQLESALQKISTEQQGILIYMRQEGRGIGLGNKIRAYALQEEKCLDTVQANEALGFPIDARNYEFAALILKRLGVLSVRLMTSNPLKIKNLESCDVIVEREPMTLPELSKQASDYISIKQAKLGHYGPN